MFPSRAKILVVDDSEYARKAIVDALRELKFTNVVEAEDVKKAQAVMGAATAHDPVCLVISDLNMPELTGLQLLKWLRDQVSLKGLPVIILTSSQDKTDILEAGRLGASQFIIKPFDAAALRDRLTSTWERQGQKYFEALKKAAG